MRKRIPQGRPVDVEGDVSVETPAGPLHVQGQGDKLTLQIPDWTAGVSLLPKLFNINGRQRRLNLGRLAAALRYAGVQVQVRIGEQVLARAGRDARPAWLTRLLGIGNVELSARQVPRLAWVYAKSGLRRKLNR